MKTRKGITVSEGIAIAKAIIMDSDEYQIPLRIIDKSHCSAEVDRLNSAFENAIDELLRFETGEHELAHKTIKDIYAVHQQFLQDKSLHHKIVDMIKEECITAE